MKKAFFMLLTFFIVSVAFAGSYTPNLNLYKPSANDHNWSSLMNANFDLLDSAINSKASATSGATQAQLDSKVSTTNSSGEGFYGRSLGVEGWYSSWDQDFSINHLVFPLWSSVTTTSGDVAWDASAHQLLISYGTGTDVFVPSGTLSTSGYCTWNGTEIDCNSTALPTTGGTMTGPISLVTSSQTISAGSDVTTQATGTGSLFLGTNGNAYLKTKGTGTTGWVNISSSSIYKDCYQHVRSSVTGTTGETTLFTCTVAGGDMGANGSVHLDAAFGWTGSSNAKTLKVYLNSTAILSSSQTTTANVQAGYVTTCSNRNSVSSQVCRVSSLATTGPGAGSILTASIDTSQDFTIRITGTLANAGETINLEDFIAGMWRP